MNKTLRYAVLEAAGAADDTARIHAGTLSLPVIAPPVAAAGIKALSSAAPGLRP